ncbi:cation-translocating P-type ATPase [Desulfatitalea alkaliphila]|uniref:Cation-transporting P-type ATPase n=1 Tax=Desulfatitalea alkaliphila TaxID=2929485 RepID=A0AA41UJI2_9BACT|nr:cation-transporting P-type ATPase [Desulfatitalea alkaliphila]MCJ8500547.1 cation-transporting P-type ATPase [Desulfatitalea alkaliphila]
MEPQSRSDVSVPEGAWHSKPVGEILQAFEVSEAGLTSEAARQRLAEHGPNQLPQEAPEGLLRRFVRQFNDVLIYVLMAAAVITAFLGEWIDTGVILAVVLINAVIGFVQEGKAEAALESIRKMLSLNALVARDGRRVTVEADQIVPGDVVYLESGDRVPADVRIIEARNLRVEEAALTGESLPVEKQTDPVAPTAELGDRSCMAYSGTVVTSGRLTGVVTATGRHTEIGRIGEMVARVEKLTTPLLRAVNRFGKLLSAVILGVALVVFFFGLGLRGFSVVEMFLIVVSLAVAAIPEGLPAIMTITLALGVQRMAQRNAIIRRLPAVETLGSVTVICSDKTGTLTRNEMTVTEVVLPDGNVAVSGTGYDPEGDFEQDGQPVDPAAQRNLHTLILAGVLCNDAEVRQDPEKGYIVDGDPTEGAMVALGMKAGLDRDQLQRERRRVDVIPFESDHRFMATLHDNPEGGRLIYLKGAPEAVLPLCERQGLEGDAGSLDTAFWEERTDVLAEKGYRVLAVACKETDHDTISFEDVQDGMSLMGCVGMIDPPRPEAIQAIEECRQAGIRVKMITGDHAVTARSIGARMGIGDGEKALTGRQLEEMDDEQLRQAVLDHDVFARSSPEHKLRLVEALQSHGEVVSMTGDGVNDAPALKRADVGVAMGIKGSEASKEAAAMVLADDNFATIKHAVEEGRTIYDNLKKTILFILPTNGAEALIVLATVLFAFNQLPITPVQILWVNMITAVTLALALAFEPSEPGIMRRPPRDPNEPIVSGYLLWRIGFVSVLVACFAIGLFFYELDNGVSLLSARTMAVNVLVAGQLFYLFNSRFIMQSSLSLKGLLSNRAALMAVGLLTLFQLMFTYLPPFQLWFGTEAIRPVDWLLILGAGVAVFFIVELEKAVVRRWRKAR